MLHAGRWSSRHVQQGASASQPQGSAAVRTVTAAARKPRPVVGCSTVVRRPHCGIHCVRATCNTASGCAPLRATSRSSCLIALCSRVNAGEHIRDAKPCITPATRLRSRASLLHSLTLPHLVRCETIQYSVQCPSAHLPLPPRCCSFPALLCSARVRHGPSRRPSI
jgi:hypothetical protein